MKKNKKSNKFNIKEIITNKQYRSIAILLFYAILFIVIIIGLRMPSNYTENNNGGNITNLKGYQLIDSKNFNYKYTLLVDDNLYVYEGKKYNNKELFSLTSNNQKEEYYIDGKKSYMKKNNQYKLQEEKPYILFDFFDVELMEEIISRSVYKQEGSYSNQVTNQELHNVIGEGFKKYEEEFNYINLIYRNDNIVGVVLDLSNYAKAIYEDYNTIIITLEYSNFNIIDDFNVDVIE